MKAKESRTKTQKRVLWAIIILAVVLRAAVAIWLGDTLGGAQQVRVYDQHSYHMLAQSLLAGKGYSFDQPWYPFRDPAGTPTAHWSFLYPLYLSSVYAITGPHPLAARLVQVLIIGLLNTWLVYRLGRRLFGENPGLVAAGLSAVYPYFIFHDATLMTEPFFITGVLASLELSLDLANIQPKSEPGKTIKSKTIWRWILLGVILGLSALLRQTVLLWVPFLLLWLYLIRNREKRGSALRGVVVSTGVILLFILPWTVRNYRVYRGFLPLNSNAGYALYSANHPHHGTHFDQDYAAELPEELTARGLSEVEWNAELTRRGVQFILEDPGRYILLSLNRVGTYFNFWFSKESSLSSNLMRVFSFGLYLPFFLAGLFLSWTDRRRCSLLYLFGVIFSAIHILTWASVRYRLPVDAAFMPFAGLAVWTIIFKITKTYRNVATE